MYQLKAFVIVVLFIFPLIPHFRSLEAQSAPELTLEQAISRALDNHPALAAASLRIGGSKSLIRQARARPNPVLDVSTENWRFYGTPGFQASRDLDAFAFLSQTFETGGKRAHRVELAHQGVRIADLEKQALQWRIRQDVRKFYLSALLAEKEHDLKTQTTRDFQEVIRYHTVRVAEGAMAEADLMKVRLEGERLALVEASARLEAERARMELLAAMGQGAGSPEFRLVDTTLGASTGPALDRAALLVKSHESRIEMSLALAAVDEAGARLGFERASARPDWTTSLGYKRTTGYNTFLAGISIPLPLFDRNEGRIAFQVNEIERARALVRMVTLQVDNEVLSAVSTLRRRHSMLQKLHGGILEQAEDAWKVALAAYQEGGFDLSRLLEAQRTLYDVRLLHVQNDIEYRLAVAYLEAAVGQEGLVLGEELLRDDQ